MTQEQADGSADVALARQLLDAFNSAGRRRVDMIEHVTDLGYAEFCTQLDRGTHCIDAGLAAIRVMTEHMGLFAASLCTEVAQLRSARDIASFPLGDLEEQVTAYVGLLNDIDPSTGWPFSHTGNLEVETWADRYAREHTPIGLEDILYVRQVHQHILDVAGVLPAYAQAFVDIRVSNMPSG